MAIPQKKQKNPGLASAQKDDIVIENLKCKKQGCGKELSDQEKLDCEKSRMVPLCSTHLQWARDTIAKCAPLFGKIGL